MPMGKDPPSAWTALSRQAFQAHRFRHLGRMVSANRRQRHIQGQHDLVAEPLPAGHVGCDDLALLEADWFIPVSRGCSSCSCCEFGELGELINWVKLSE